MEIEENKIHKPGQKHDPQLFEQQYRDKVSKWMKKKQKEPAIRTAAKVERSMSQNSKRSKVGVVVPVRPATALCKKTV